MSKLTDKRLYVLEATDTKAERLMWAANKSRAVRLAATARIATQDDVVRLLEKGITPEGQLPDRRPKNFAQRRAQPTGA